MAIAAPGWQTGPAPRCGRAGVERQPDALHRGRRQPGLPGDPRHARPLGRVALPPHRGSVRRPPAGQHHGDRGQHDDQHARAPAEDQPVGGDARIGVHGTHRAERRHRRQHHGHADGEQGPGHHGTEHAGQPVADRRGRARAEGPQRIQVPGVGAQLPAGHLARDDQRGQPGDPAEHGQRDRRGLDGSLRLGFGERRDVELNREALRQQSLDAGLSGRHLGGASVELNGAFGEAGTAPQQPPGDRRGEQRATVPAGVDLVLHHLVAEHRLADDLRVEPQERPPAGLARGLSVREETDGDDVADVHLGGGALRVDHDLARPSRVGHPALDDGDAVLAEELAVDAARQRLRRPEGGAIRAEDGDVEPGVAFHPPHVRQPDDRTDHRGVVPRVTGGRFVQAGEHGEVGRVGAGDIRRERRLGPPGRRDRAQGQAANQPEQQHQREVPAPAVPERGPEPVPRDAERWWAHLSVPRGTSHLRPAARCTAGVTLSWSLAACRAAGQVASQPAHSGASTTPPPSGATRSSRQR